MLARVAENLYWLARYLERAEGTARLLSASSHMQLDLPRGAPLSWRSLVDILGARHTFEASHHQEDEKGVLRFLLTDARSPNSVLTAILQARENARVCRDNLPADAWETINEMALHVRETASAATSRRKRFDLLRRILQSAQQFSGIMVGSMSRGAGWHAMALGQHLERADMTTRILDVRFTSLIPLDDDAHAAMRAVCWTSVLRSMGAYEMYRRDVHGHIVGRDVVRYLLHSPRFPRSVAFSLQELHRSLEALPYRVTAHRTLEQVETRLEGVAPQLLSPEAMHQTLDLLQSGLGQLHNAISDGYFRYHDAA